MKALLPLLCLPCLAADPRFATLLRDTSLELRAGESAELVSAIGSQLSLAAYVGGEAIGGFNLLSGEGKFPPFAVAGPASLRLVSNGQLGEVGHGFATFRVWPGTTDPQSVALVAPTTNAVTIRLEASTNLVHWTTVHEFTATNLPSATFYRATSSP
jgi:hypothetical protein